MIFLILGRCPGAVLKLDFRYRESSLRKRSDPFVDDDLRVVEIGARILEDVFCRALVQRIAGTECVAPKSPLAHLLTAVDRGESQGEIEPLLEMLVNDAIRLGMAGAYAAKEHEARCRVSQGDRSTRRSSEETPRSKPRRWGSAGASSRRSQNARASNPNQYGRPTTGDAERRRGSKS